MPRYWIMLAMLMTACGCKSGQWPWSTNNPANRIPPPATGSIGKPAVAPAGSPYYTPPTGTGAAAGGWQAPPASAGYAPAAAPYTPPYNPPAGLAPLSPMPPAGSAPYTPPGGQFSPPGGFTTPPAASNSTSLSPDTLAASDNGWVPTGTRRRASGTDAFRDVSTATPGAVAPAAAWGTSSSGNAVPISFASAPDEGTARLESPVRIVEAGSAGFTPTLNGMPISDASQMTVASHTAATQPVSPAVAPVGYTAPPTFASPPAYNPSTGYTPPAAYVPPTAYNPAAATAPAVVAPAFVASNVPVGTGVSSAAMTQPQVSYSNSYSPLSDFQPAREAVAPSTLATIPASAPGSVQPAGVLMQPAPNAFPGNVPASYVPPNPQAGMSQPGVPQPFVPRGTAYPLTPSTPAAGTTHSSTTGPYVPQHSSWAGGQPVRGFARPAETNPAALPVSPAAVPLSTPVIFASTPTPATAPPATAPATTRPQQVQYAYQPDYETLRGRLEYSHTIQKWKLRYISPDAAESQVDELGGYVVFDDVPQLGGFRTGDFVVVEGSLDDKTGDLGKYMLRTIRRLE